MRTEVETPVVESRQVAGRGRHRRRASVSRRRRTVTLAIAASFFTTLPAELADLPQPILVTVRDVVRSLAPGTTLGSLADAEGLRPRAGDFVDVEGRVLDAGRYPGALLLNGEPAGRAAVLSDGDVVRVVHGKDRQEPLVKEIVPVAGGRPANPQATLATAPGEQVITKGKLSGKVVSSVFRATGPYAAPPRVALTFDDGPSPAHTPKILDILARFDVRATFYVVGTMVERSPGIVRRAASEGHAVANHTHEHPLGASFAERSRAQIREQIDRLQRVLRQLGITPTSFRPPGGSWSDVVRDEAAARGMRTVLWSLDSEDWRGATAQELTERVLAEARPGSIILLHDGGGDRSATVEALPAIIRGLRERGLEPVAIT